MDLKRKNEQDGDVSCLHGFSDCLVWSGVVAQVPCEGKSELLRHENADRRKSTCGVYNDYVFWRIFTIHDFRIYDGSDFRCDFRVVRFFSRLRRIMSHGLMCPRPSKKLCESKQKRRQCLLSVVQ